MISGISGGTAVGDFSRSLEALSALLKSSNQQSIALAEKLLRVDVQQTIQDSAVGTRVDTSA
jgi:hypothetical protein